MDILKGTVLAPVLGDLVEEGVETLPELEPPPSAKAEGISGLCPPPGETYGYEGRNEREGHN